MSVVSLHDTNCAISTPIGEGGIGIVRLSGREAIALADSICSIQSKARLISVPSHTVHYGHVIYKNEMIDEVLVSVYRKPRSYTKEDIVEIIKE